MLNSESAALELLQSIHDGKSHIGHFLTLAFHGLPVNVFWIDIQSVVQGCNQVMAEFLGEKSPEDIIHKNLSDLFKEEEDINLLTLNNLKTIQDHKLSCYLEPVKKQNKRLTFYSTKIPVYSAFDDTDGVVGFSIPLHNTPQLMIDQKQLPQLHNIFDKNTNYYITIENRTIKLTARQAECLTHIAMGKTVKQVANILGCTASNVESHINIIKRKFNIYSTAVLIQHFWDNPIRWW